MRWRLWFVVVLFSCTTGQRESGPRASTGTPGEGSAAVLESADHGGKKARGKKATTPAKGEAYYEDGSEEEPDGLAKDAFEVIVEYYEKLNVPLPRYDGRLARAAQEYAANVPEVGTLPRGFVDFHLAREGIAEPYPKIVSFVFPESARGEFLDKLSGAMDRIVPGPEAAEQRVGIGLAKRGDKLHVVLAMLPGRLQLDALPRTASPGETLIISGGVKGAYHSPRLVITGPDGATITVRSEPRSSAQKFALEARLDAGEGRYEIEIVADGATGPEVCGLFSVYAGVEPPTEPVLSMAPKRDKPLSAEEAEKIIFDLVNAERKKLGLPALTLLKSAQKVARAYSDEMKLTGKVGHISAISGRPEERLKKGGVKASLVLENVARSYSPEDAHAGLMDSPGHRANILNPRVTHLGVGVAVALDPNSPPAYYVTQSFVRLGSPDIKTLQKELPAALSQGRAAAGLGDLIEDPKLSEVAARYIAKFESGEMDKEAVAKAVFAELTKFGATYGVAAPLVTSLPYLDPIAKARGLDDAQFTHYGAALAVSSKKSPLGEGQVAVILILVGLR